MKLLGLHSIYGKLKFLEDVLASQNIDSKYFSMVVILLSSPLQPQSDTKVIPDKKATLMTGGFLLADSMLEVYHE